MLTYDTPHYFAAADAAITPHYAADAITPLPLMSLLPLFLAADAADISP